MPSDRRYRASFDADPTLRARLFELLEAVFPGVTAVEARSRQAGAAWQDVSTPFVRVEGERVLAHVGVLGMTLVVDGRDTPVGVVHGVATHPAHRRRGLYRSLIEEALHWCDRRWTTVVLCTERPEYYAPFGFRVVPEHRFTGTMPHGSGATLRPIDPGHPAERAWLHQLLDRRAPVSYRLGVIREKAAFFFNEGHRTLHGLADPEAVVCLDRRDGRLRVFDIVAGPEVSPGDVMSRLAGAGEPVEVYFSPDRLGIDLAPGPWTLDGTVLMVRGAFPCGPRPVMLPRPARC